MKRQIKVYLDTSVYNRPFDDQSQSRVRLEAEAFLLILEKAISGSITVIGSSALLYENSRNPFAERKERVSSYMDMASKVIMTSDSIKKRALALELSGISPLDALHLAFAEAGGVEYFVTCDHAIIKKARKGRTVPEMIVCNPLEFVLEEVFKNA